MPEARTESSKRVLNPLERISEVLFGLIMVLTFTSSLRAGEEDVRTMLIGALGCNLAWGLIDAVMYLMACYSERGRGILALRALRNATDLGQARGIIAENLPPLLAAVIPEQQFELIRQKLNGLPEPPERPWLTKGDWKDAAEVFLLVFLSTFPVVIPFLFIREASAALRVSNTLAVIMLFLTDTRTVTIQPAIPGEVDY